MLARIYRDWIVVVVFLTLLSCSVSSEKTRVVVAIPFKTMQANIPQLSGEVSVSGMEGVFPMSIVGAQASVEIPAVRAGNHTFTIRFYSDQIIIAEVKFDFNVGGEQNEVYISYTSSQFNYNFDDDGDGVNNYIEVISGTNPKNKDDYPEAVLIADAGVDQQVEVSSQVWLNASESRFCTNLGGELTCMGMDEFVGIEGSVVYYTWSFLSKPSGSKAMINNNGTPQPYFMADLAGTYEVQLELEACIDSDCISDTDTVVITATSGLPLAPSNLVAEAISQTQVDLSWTDNSTDETGFVIERYTEPGSSSNFAQIATTGANITSWSDFTVTAGNTYHYRVKAVNNNGSSPYSNEVQVSTGVSGQWVASLIGAGGYHACAVDTTGGVFCWGYNDHGEVGNGNNSGPNTCIYESESAACSMRPVKVASLSGVAKVVAGGYHTCILTDVGGVKCWGYNDSGQLGKWDIY